ncbi:NADPH-dependent FMN reductase [Propylenella binzhouense]|uniref:NADPH-dependent oxidoreductase n=1 Tax=Propylenella binzhouense TaxID=2555902 RepID=A0A964T6M7_9HYPH|nr:NAD(P)H-dependent oxidoreductase [Propylenella binzhouense]MYZ49453.1 NADPH-dependent oxidoreductase [Propylenella binzhouense]
MPTPRLAVIIGSIRPNRFADHPAAWIAEIARKRGDFDVEIVDLKDYPMPIFAEAVSPAYGPSEDPVARRWQSKIAEFDAYVILAAEYGRGPTGALKNALDYSFKEWNNKPVSFVGYGGVGGARAVEQLRLNAIELQMAPIRTAVHIQLPVYLAVAKEGKSLAEFDFLNQNAEDMLDQLAWWAGALKAARQESARLAA